MKDVLRGIKFGEERVAADGHHFIDCVFENTTLVYRGGDKFLIEGGEFKGTIVFEGEAANTILALQALYDVGLQSFVEMIIDSIRNPLGGSVN